MLIFYKNIIWDYGDNENSNKGYYANPKVIAIDYRGFKG
jgi:hypothetical protein